MKRTMYFLLALLVALTLVVGVSCNGDNKTPEDGTKYQKYDLGTEKLVAPEWLYGTFTGSIPVESGPEPVTLTIDANGIEGIPPEILPASGDLNITNQYYVGYTYILEYDMAGEKMAIEVVRQTYRDLEVSYYINGDEVLSRLLFTRVE